MNQLFILQIELIINNNLYNKEIIDEETFIKFQDIILKKIKKEKELL